MALQLMAPINGTQFTNVYTLNVDGEAGFIVSLYGLAGTYDVEVSVDGVVWGSVQTIVLADATAANGANLDYDFTRAAMIRINKTDAGIIDDLIANLKLQ